MTLMCPVSLYRIVRGYVEHTFIEQDLTFGLLSCLDQGCTNPGCQVATATKFCMVAPNICGCLVQNLLFVTILAHTVLIWPLDFWKFCAPLV
jgi:hypothetical protein